MLAALILVPSLAGLLAFWWKGDASRRALLILAAAAHSSLTAAAWHVRPGPALGGWVELDTTGLCFLSITSALFLAAAVYAIGYLSQERSKRHLDFHEGFLFANSPEAVFTGCLLLFLASMTLVTASQHFGLLWVTIEATTLASAPLIYFHRHHRSLEATWKYLLICSVGIALALLGNFVLAVAAASGGGPPNLFLSSLIAQASAGGLHAAWLKAAFVLFLVGYGTKMGLAPMHTWLPDAHSEAPSVVSALLSGGLLNCAFLGILRAHSVCIAAGQGPFSQELLVALGLASMGVAAVFILGQPDFKRLLAYSSIEHMGILALGVGLGGAAAFGSLLHAVNHSLTKACLFLVAGNILAAYKTKSAGEVTGLARVLPISAFLWVAGFLAIIGSPPFGLFLSEFTILKGALDQGRGAVATAYLVLLAVVFIGMASIVLGMAQGDPDADRARRSKREMAWSTIPPGLLMAATLALGLYVPPPMSRVLHEIARSLGGA